MDPQQDAGALTRHGKQEARTTTRAERRARKAERERLRLAYMRRRRRLRADDVTVVEESSLRRAIMGSVVGNIMEWYDVGVYAYVAVLVGQAFLPAATASTPSANSKDSPAQKRQKTCA